MSQQSGAVAAPKRKRSTGHAYPAVSADGYSPKAVKLAAKREHLQRLREAKVAKGEVMGRRKVARVYRGKRRVVDGMRFRSEAEVGVWEALKSLACGFHVTYERRHINYTTIRTYTPDFHVIRPGLTFFIEVKGYLSEADRRKYREVRATNPEIDLRFLFMKPNTRIEPGSPTTYGAWATKLGFLWGSTSDIPMSWFDSPPGEPSENGKSSE